MSLTSATLTISFTANYSGDHRVCWKVQGETNYTCTTVSCVTGNTCSFDIPIEVNTTSCDGPITFEGYVQASCRDESTTEGRIYWSSIFTPSVVCKRYNITCEYAPIVYINITSSGTGYVVGDIVVIKPVDPLNPNLSNATITIASVDDDGRITGFTITDGGMYNSTPTISIISISGAGGEFVGNVLVSCKPVSNIGLDCGYNSETHHGYSVSLTSGLLVNNSFAVCLSTSIITLPTGYNVEQSGCCISEDSTETVCKTYTIVNTSTKLSISIPYTACNGVSRIITLPANSGNSVCAIDGGVLNPNLSFLTITDTNTACN